MTVAERSVWVQLVIMPLVGIAYFAVILTRAADAPASEVSWIAPMIWAMSIIVAGIIAGTIASTIAGAIAATARGNEPDLEEGDRRDKEIERIGNLAGVPVTGAGTLAVIILCMLRVDPMWIASTMFLTGIVAGVRGAVVKLRAYRRGF